MNLKPIISIQQLLINQGIDRNAKIKLVRHTDKRYPDLYDWYCSDKKKFFDYFKKQSDEVFSKCDYVVAFIGELSTLARFIGVFKVDGVTAGFDDDGACFYYDLMEEIGYESLKERVIIDWGKSTVSWHQWFENEKEVVEIKSRPDLNYVQFKNYDDIIIKFSELQVIVKHEYKEWKHPLLATNAIYLILDKKEGKQYVGSTYGGDGIWGRWCKYAKDGHGGNKLLIELLNSDKNYASNFQWSILTTLPKTITKEEAIKIESKYKIKLGSRAFGLNAN
jgi:hypothetical protein